ncbi:MAG: hypothetical protein ACKO0Z_07425 [Betaproteobacteria bacterium]
MPSVEYNPTPIEDGKAQEPTKEQKAHIAKYNAEVAAETLCKAMEVIAVEERRIQDIARRYDSRIDGNDVQRDLEAFCKRIDDLLLTKRVKEFLAARALEGLI